MRASYHSIFISPHLDDVVLSCGGQISRQVTEGRSVLIVTVMAGDPPEDQLTEFALSLHGRWQTPEKAIRVRRDEDILACSQLGAEYLHWEFLDCIYRINPQTGTAIYNSEQSLFGMLHDGDAGLLNKLVQKIRNLPTWNSLFIPLSVGNHVDHQLCRKAAEQLYKPDKLLYYEEYPYAASTDITAHLVPAELNWRSNVITLEAAELLSKIKAIAHYKSQLSTFFVDYNDMVEKVTDYIKAVGGERIWYSSKQLGKMINSTLG